ncbi:hypothetical protein RLJV_19365 [Pseudomonas aeruginosa]|nr:hypothetical protein RLJV_19365 [Pseudomonas aeruginosa]
MHTLKLLPSGTVIVQEFRANVLTDDHAYVVFITSIDPARLILGLAGIMDVPPEASEATHMSVCDIREIDEQIAYPILINIR